MLVCANKLSMRYFTEIRDQGRVIKNADFIKSQAFMLLVSAYKYKNNLNKKYWQTDKSEEIENWPSCWTLIFIRKWFLLFSKENFIDLCLPLLTTTSPRIKAWKWQYLLYIKMTFYIKTDLKVVKSCFTSIFTISGWRLWKHLFATLT